MNMQAKVLQTDHYNFDGRGESLLHWICDADILFADPEIPDSFAQLPGGICGAQHQSGWVLFHGLQVLQIVPEEVHSYWYLDFILDAPKKTGVWEIEASNWIKTFNPRHLAEHKHFIIEFYDEIVEVISRDLIFGAGTFHLDTVLETEYRLRYAHLRHAMIQEKLGNRKEAVDYYQRYIDSSPDDSSMEYARRCFSRICDGEVED